MFHQNYLSTYEETRLKFSYLERNFDGFNHIDDHNADFNYCKSYIII